MLISAGSNATATIVDAAAIVQKCKRDLALALGAPVSASRIYRTPAFPPGAGPDFANAVFSVPTTLSPKDVLVHLHRLEADAGRVRDQRWGQRVLDLDLIAYGDTVAPDLAVWQRWHDLPLDQQMQKAPDQLILPHPRAQDRPFVLVPLRDLCPAWVHPVLGLDVDAMLARCDPADIAAVVALD
ncbi:2-amino-4-hydroxy-6-hydroxymethyldihydropteridine diphosphokinase [Yoonia sp. R2331]|uniref:2-amino-4-hydroxy-6- hydroxymethyldihydropteridine diphosphokinase n=1 Tax=Yoonia sp. R2331 TaxID=3237238 RepID=UPI0034E58CAE